MDPATGAMIGGGLGAFKSLNDKIKEDAAKKQREQLLKLYPWMHMQFGGESNRGMEAALPAPTEVNTLGNIAGGAASGANMGQSFKNQDAMNAWLQMHPGEQPPSGNPLSSNYLDQNYKMPGGFG